MTHESPELAAALVRLEQLHPRKIDLSLDRLRALLADLGHPERAVPPVIHVAGTNGKGSTVAMLRAMLEAGGRRIQAYTSPHLVRFNERIRLPDGDIADEPLLDLIAEIERVNGTRPITFFEVTTAVAFLAFARNPADLLLLEVGLGGRLDATNVIDRPAATIVTAISRDHVDWFGSDIAGIAGEKAGIIKPGVPAIIGPQPEAAAAAVFEREAGERGAPLFRAGREWRVTEAGEGFRYDGARWQLDLPVPALPGRHQIDNAGGAIAALEQLPALDVTAAEIAAGLRETRWPARLQRLTQGPLPALLPTGTELWLDGGHNPAGGAALGDMAGRWRAADGKPLHLILGMLTTKDVAGFLSPLLGRIAGVTLVEVPGAPASFPLAALEQAVRSAASEHQGLRIETAPDVASALAGLRSAIVGPARILICGSLYLAGTVLAQNG